VAAAYGSIITRRNRRFDAGRGVVRLDRPVISVGNLSVGGTGKTPMVLHLTRVLLAAGRRPCIAMRGYGAAPGESDEALSYQRDLPGIPIVAQPNRTDGLLELFAERGDEVDCVVLDDGFQHRQIARDFDIVLIDATRPPSADSLLPAGWLREPMQSLQRAHAVVVTHAEAVTRTDAIAVETHLWEYVPKAVTAVCRHEWSALHRVGHDEPLDTAWLAGKEVFACCAIGNPGAFLAQAERLASRSLVGSRVLSDHDPFAPATIAALLEDLDRLKPDALLITEKDWSKLLRVKPEAWPCPVLRPRLELRFDRGGKELDGAVLGCIEQFSPGPD